MLSERVVFLVAGLLCLGLSSCSPPPADDSASREAQIVPIETVAATEAGQALPFEAAEKLAIIRETASEGSIRGMVKLAEGEPQFRSNVDLPDLYTHWYLMKRAGLDPLKKIIEITDYPYEMKDFGEEQFYIWPYLAARSNEELQSERLSFKERAELLELVGQQGVSEIADGSSYPGFRLAITNDGRWAYFVNSR